MLSEPMPNRAKTFTVETPVTDSFAKLVQDGEEYTITEVKENIATDMRFLQTAKMVRIKGEISERISYYYGGYRWVRSR